MGLNLVGWHEFIKVKLETPAKVGRILPISIIMRDAFCIFKLSQTIKLLRCLLVTRMINCSLDWLKTVRLSAHVEHDPPPPPQLSLSIQMFYNCQFPDGYSSDSHPPLNPSPRIQKISSLTRCPGSQLKGRRCHSHKAETNQDRWARVHLIGPCWWESRWEKVNAINL